MLSLCFPAPLGHSRGPVMLIIILEKENVDRMRAADPFDFLLRTDPRLRGIPADAIDLVIAYEEDREKLMELSKRGDIMAMIEYIERGREIKIPCDMEPPRILK